LPLAKWMIKWLMVFCALSFLANRLMVRMDFAALMHFYQTMFGMILLICIIYVNIQCLAWSFIRVL
jgi:hypothetical protein